MMRFVKMHGLGNDFIIMEDTDSKLQNPAAKAIDWCRRCWSVGADGLVLIQKSQSADYRMRIFNSDGSEAEMCGNALRCVAVYIKRYMGGGDEALIEVGGTLKKTFILPDGMVRVNMGAPILKSSQIPVTGEERQVIDEDITVKDKSFQFTAVSMGNPHCVIFREKIDDELLSVYGPLIEVNELFPRNINVEFVRVNNRQSINVLVWERGVGKTLACGTGACATVVAGVLKGILDKAPVEVTLPGGKLRITWEPGKDVLMEGPVEEVFHGEIKD